MHADPTAASSQPIFDDENDLIAYNRVWFNIMRAHRKFHPLVLKALKSSGIKDPIWYEILLEVDLAGPDGHLMSALEEKLFVPQYALSRHISRLEAEGFVRRDYILDGRRKQILFLTDKGTGVHEAVWPIYWDTMQDLIAPHMSTDEAYKLAKLLIKLLP